MKKISKILCLALIAVLVAVAIPSQIYAKKAPSLSTKKLTVKVGEKKKLVVKNAGKKVSYTVTSGKNNVKLSNKKKTGVTILGKKKGNAKISVTTSGKTLICNVVVQEASKENTPDNTNQTDNTVKNIVIDMSKVGQTSFSAGGAKIDFRDQLDSKFDLKYFSELKVSYELVFEGNDSSDYNITKIGIADSDATLTGYADGVAFAYPLEVGKTEASVPIKEDVTGPAVGINIQPMNATWAWPNKLTKVTITGLEFVAREGAKYSGSGEGVATEPTPGEAYAPETFVYEGLDQEYLKTLDPSKKTVAFTFDDGPVGVDDTSASMIIQKTLKEHGAHATFFYIGGNVNAAGRKEIQMAKENGFEVGNHSWGWASVSDKEDEIKQSIGKTNDVLKEITGYSNFLFRAPNLAINENMKKYIKAPFINCTLDSKDWTGAKADEIYKTLTKPIADGQNLDGSIILMHENTETYKTINEVIEYYQEAGYQIVSVSELFALKGKELTTGKVYTTAR